MIYHIYFEQNGINWYSENAATAEYADKYTLVYRTLQTVAALYNRTKAAMLLVLIKFQKVQKLSAWT